MPKEYYVHILNWGPIEAENAEEAAKIFHEEIKHSWSGFNPVYTVTEEGASVDMWSKEEEGTAPWRLTNKEFDSELWEENEEQIG